MQLPQTQTTRTNANENYSHFNGTDHFYKHSFGFVYTDGVAQVAEDYKAYWFIDIILSYQGNKQVRREEFQGWKLSRIKGDSFIVICEDGNDIKVISQKIAYSDFKDDDLTFWLANKTIMLPSEY